MDGKKTSSIPKMEQSNAANPLPLFRPEALASQGNQLYGEILLVRPLSLALLGWLGICIAAATLAFLLLGSFTEKMRVAGVLASSGAGLEARLYVPGRFATALKPGSRIGLACPDCPDARLKQPSGAVTSIVPSSRDHESSAAASPNEYLVTVTLAPPYEITLPSAQRVEADLTLGRRPLLKWMFERPGR